MGRKIEDEGEARAFLKAAKTARLSVGDWAREHGIDGRSLSAWRVNLARGRARSRAKRAKPRLVELVADNASPHGGAMIVSVAGAEVRVARGFDEEAFVRLVRALRSC